MISASLDAWPRLSSSSQAKDSDHDQVEKAEGHRPRSCRNLLIRPNRRSQSLGRVLERYTGTDQFEQSMRDLAAILPFNVPLRMPKALSR
jgi:hypothetical protein